jgi:hypothetical protein
MGAGQIETTYTFELSLPGRLLNKIIRHTPEGDTQIPINDTDKRFCHFLNWASREPKNTLPSSYNFLETDAEFICGDADLFAYCKQRNIMLSTVCDVLGGTMLMTEPHESQIGSRQIVLRHSESSGGSNVHLFRLYRAVQSPRGDFPSRWDDRLACQPLPLFVTGSLWANLNNAIAADDSEIRKLSSWPVEKTFVYVDISEFFRHPASHQVLIVNSLVSYANDERFWRGNVTESKNDCEARLCIGDGYIFVFKNPGHAVFFSAYLASLIEGIKEDRGVPDYHYRIGVHSGKVYRFWDRDRKDYNYIGDGINNAQRVLSAIGKEQDDVVFISSDTRQHILTSEPENSFSSGAITESRGWLATE